MQKLAFIAFLFALMISLFGVARGTNNPIQKQGQNIPTLKLKEYMAKETMERVAVAHLGWSIKNYDYLTLRVFRP